MLEETKITVVQEGLFQLETRDGSSDTYVSFFPASGISARACISKVQDNTYVLAFRKDKDSGYNKIGGSKFKRTLIKKAKECLFLEALEQRKNHDERSV